MGRNKRKTAKKSQAKSQQSNGLKRFLLIHADWAYASEEKKHAKEWRAEDMQGVTAALFKAKSKDALMRHYLRKPPGRLDDSWEDKLDELFPGFPDKTEAESKQIVDSFLQMERKTEKKWEGGDPLTAFFQSSDVILGKDPDHYVSVLDFKTAFFSFCRENNVPKNARLDAHLAEDILEKFGCKVVQEVRVDPAHPDQPKSERGWVVGCTLPSIKKGHASSADVSAAVPREKEIKQNSGVASVPSAVDAIDRLSVKDAEFLWCWLNAASSSRCDDIPEKHREQYTIVDLDELEQETESID